MSASSFGREEKAVLQERGVIEPYPLEGKLPPASVSCACLVALQQQQITILKCKEKF